MGVSHLRRDASSVASGRFRGNTGRSPQAQQTEAGPNFKRPASTSGTTRVPDVGAVDSFDSKSVKPGNPARPLPFGGPRAGGKSGQERTGEKSGNKRPMSGGRLG